MPEKENELFLSKSILWLMAIGAGLVVANNYYNQPLLGVIAKELGESESATSKVAMFTQMGYAAGLLLIIPLGYMFRRKKIILIDFFFIILSLVVFALSKSLIVMLAASFCIGLTSVVPQIFVPIAAQLSRPEEKGRNVGIVMSGLLIGILGSRVFSGIVGEYLGWRNVFLIAAGLMIILAVLIAWMLPNMQPTFKGTYGQLKGSVIRYARSIPSLQLASLRGALGFQASGSALLSGKRCGRIFGVVRNSRRAGGYPCRTSIGQSKQKQAYSHSDLHYDRFVGSVWYGR
mgnify:CR=1 FL=1